MEQFGGSREQNAVKWRTNKIEIKDVNGSVLFRDIVSAPMWSMFFVNLFIARIFGEIFGEIVRNQEHSRDVQSE